MRTKAHGTIRCVPDTKAPSDITRASRGEELEARKSVC
jgi:hypothetical protein